MEIVKEEEQECRQPLLQHDEDRRAERDVEIEREEQQVCREVPLQHEVDRRAEAGLEIEREEEKECREVPLQHEREGRTEAGLEIEREEEAGLEIEREEGQECRPRLPRLGGFKRCCREIQLQEFRDMFVFKSVDPDAPDAAFSIGRTDGVIRLLDGNCINLEKPAKISTIYGVAGTIKLLAGTYVLVITSREEVGSYLGFPIFLVTSMKFLCCNEALRHSTSQEKRDEAYFMTLLRTVESTPGLYYSYEGDLTLNMQMSSRLSERRTSIPLWKQADPRFVWNRVLLEELIESKLDAFSIPMIQGSIHALLFPEKYCIACLCMHLLTCMSLCLYMLVLRWAR